MKRLLPFVVTMLALLFPALASAQNEQGKITITQVEHCTLKVTYTNTSWKTVVVNSGDMVKKESVLRFSATVDDGYFLLCYVVNGEEVSIATASAKVEGDMVISAKVQKKESVPVTIVQPEHGTITVQDKSNNNAEVSSGDLVMTGNELTVKVAPDEGYQIKHWLINDKEKALTRNDKNTTLEMVVGATKISALIEPIPAPSKLTLAVDPDYGGSLEAHKEYAFKELIPDLDKVTTGSQVCLKLIPKEGYSIKHWVVDGVETPPQSTSPYSRNNFTFIMDKDKTITAVLNVPAPPAGSHRITLVAEGKGTLVAADGSNKAVKSGDIVKEGTSLTFTATPAEGYEVDTWYVNGTEVFGSGGQTTKGIEINEDTSVKVVFKQIQMYTVTYSAGENGSIVAKYGNQILTSPAKVAGGSVVKLIATPNEGYEIEGWYKNGATVADPSLGTQTEIEQDVWEDVTILVKFKETVHYTVTYEAGENGTLAATVEEGGETKDLASGGKVVAGTFVTFTATPAEGYEVDEWKVDGTVDAEHAKSLELRKEVTADTKVTVSFKKKPEPVKEFTITVNAVEPAEAGTLTVTDASGAAVLTGAKVAQGTMLTVTAEANGKYNFKNFTINKKDLDPKTEGVIKVIDKKKYTYKLEVKGSTVIGATFSKTTSAEDILAQTKEFAVVNGSIYCPGARMIALYSMDGALVRTIEAEVMEVRDLATGNYLVIATNREGVALQKKIVL